MSQSPEQAIVRADNRLPDQLRPVSFERGYTRHAPGSVLVSCGGTRVLCTVSIEDRVPGWMKGQGRGWLTAEYGMLPGATHTRSSREAARGKQSGRTQEIQRLIGRSLRAVVDLEQLGERTVAIDCDVLQADGGTRCASITGAWVALADAFGKLQAGGEITGQPLREAVAAVSVGWHSGEVLLDLDYPEDSTCGTDLNVVMTGSGGLVEVQGTAERGAFNRSELDRMLDAAQRGITQLMQLQKEALQG